MSSITDLKNTARVAIKVPSPDSLIEVRMMPPESNFEVKVTPGGDVIELLIHPGCSQIEVRIIKPENNEEEVLAEPPLVTDQKIEPREKATVEPEPTEAPLATSLVESEACAEAEEQGGEVLSGLSKKEFEAMVEEEAADQAKKLLATMPDENERLASDVKAETSLPQPLAGPEPQLPSGDEGRVGEVDIQAPSGDLEPSVDEDSKVEPNLVEILESHNGLEEGGAVPPLPSNPSTEDHLDLPGQSAQAALGEPYLDEAEQSKVELDIETQIDDLPQVDLESSTEKSPVELPYVNVLDSLVSNLSSPAKENELKIASDSHTAPPEKKMAAIPAAVEEAARQALARLSNTVDDGTQPLALELESQQPQEILAEDQAASSHHEEPIVDRTIMVEYFEDADGGPHHLPDDTATPLPEEDQMDLGSVGQEDEELAIDPIDLGNMEFDLEKSRSDGSEEGPTVVKAKPMVTAVPANTIVSS